MAQLQPQPGQTRGRGASATNDQFGMLGFNSQQEAQGHQVYRPVDLNSLGIAVSSNEQLHLSFGSPWLDPTTAAPAPAPGSPPGAAATAAASAAAAAHRLQPEYRIPECYYVTAPVIKYTLFQKLHLETLFYIFYSMPRDVLQVAAARELTSRDWRYHKPTASWLCRVQGVEPKSGPPGFQKGNFQIWNVERWCMERADNFTIALADLEDIASTTTGGGAAGNPAAAAAGAGQQQPQPGAGQPGQPK